MSARRERTFRTLDGLPLILPSEPHVLRAMLDEVARRQGISITVAVEANLSTARIVNPSLTRSIVLSMSPRRNERVGTRQAIKKLVELGEEALAPFGEAED